MNIFKTQPNWNILKGRMKEHFGELSEDDLMYLRGKEDKLVGYLQERLKMTKDDALGKAKEIADEVEQRMVDEEKQS